MISTLVNLLGSFYENKDYAKAESIANRIHLAIPGDQVSLQFLGLVYYHTGRIVDAMKVFDRVQEKQDVDSNDLPEGRQGLGSAVAAVSYEASRRVPYLAQAWRDLGNALTRKGIASQYRVVCAA